jgi:hypothetical protein
MDTSYKEAPQLILFASNKTHLNGRSTVLPLEALVRSGYGHQLWEAAQLILCASNETHLNGGVECSVAARGAGEVRVDTSYKEAAQLILGASR